MNDHSHQGYLVDLIADAVGYARICQEVVFEIVIPLLAPQRRGIAEDVQRQLRGNNYISEAFVRDLTSMLDFLQREIAAGTEHYWAPDEHNVHGGHHITQLDDRAFALSTATAQLSDLRDAIAITLDITKAGRIADDLIDN
ncbi:MAG: hypothetical protein ACU0CJ_09135 [Sulfitobacter sp.]